MRFQHFAERAPGATAIVDPAERTWSRGELCGLSNRIARALRAHGLVEGDVIAIVAPNCAEYLALYLAATQVGLYVVPVSWHLAPTEMAYILDDCAPKALFAHDHLAHAMLAVAKRLRCRPHILLALGQIAGFTPITEFVSGVSDAQLADPVEGRVMAYTSATTGLPKAVKLPLADAARVLDRAISARVAGGTAPDEHVCLCASLLYHGAPLEVATVALHMGHAVILMNRFEPERILAVIQKYRVSLAYLVPTMFTRLLAMSAEQRRAFDTASLRRVVHTGAPCAIEVKRRMIEWWGPILWEAYGGAEGGGTLVSSEEWLAHPGTVGKPITGSEIKIYGEHGEELPRGQMGLIYMTRYAGDRFEYKGDPEKTRASHRGAFFTLGDIGYLDDDGYLFLCDRQSDLIISFGMNIYPAEIERVLTLNANVADCAVFGIPDTLAGEVPMAVVQLRPGTIGDRQLTSELLSFLSDYLSPTKLPRRVAYTSERLRNDIGKLSRRSLQDRYATVVRPNETTTSASIA